MKNIFLLGEDNKRYMFFQKAAKNFNTEVTLIKWSELFKNKSLKSQDIEYGLKDVFQKEKIYLKKEETNKSSNSILNSSSNSISNKIDEMVKIDPPIYFDNTIKEHNISLKMYIENLKVLSQVKDIKFLNTPKNILDLLDKGYSKMKLLDKNIPVTPQIKVNYTNFQELFNELVSLKEHAVFIKPKYGSGAMGIIAMKINPKMNDAVFYTTLKYSDGNLYNTKLTNRVQGFKNCQTIFEQLFSDLEGELIIEKWLLKDTHSGENYDIRVLYLNRKILHMVGRKSKGPITNLHLNNGSFNVDELNLSPDVFVQLEQIGNKIFDTFSDLKFVGVDILVTPKKELFVIELNGQGDQIYSDMNNENKIYSEQIKELLSYE